MEYFSQELEEKLLNTFKEMSKHIYLRSKELYEKGEIEKWIYDYVDSIYHFHIPNTFDNAREFKVFCHKLDLDFLNQNKNLDIVSTEDVIIYMSSYATVTQKWINPLSMCINMMRPARVLEVACGNGMIAKGLQDNGVDIIVTNQEYSRSDGYSIYVSRPWIDIERIDAIKAIEKYGACMDYILLSWPPLDDDLDLQILKTMRKVNSSCRLILIGENESGCTGSDQFFKEAISAKLKHLDRYQSLYKEMHKGYKPRQGVHDYIQCYR